MHIVLFDKADWRKALYPLALTRPVADLRVGILTIAEKWGKWLNTSYSFLTEDYLEKKYPLGHLNGEILLIKGNCCPDNRLADAMMALRTGQVLMNKGEFIAVRTEAGELQVGNLPQLKDYSTVIYTHDIVQINHPEDIFLNN